MAAEESIPAYVLHRRPFREHTPIVEFFTPTQGRIALLAHGAASPRSRRRGLLQPFQPLLIGWSGRGNIRSLARIEAADPLIALSGTVLFCGFYLNELLMRLLQAEEPQPELFSNYAKTLRQLAAGDEPETVLRQFELLLLRTLGYGLDLLHEAESGCPIQAQGRYWVEPQSGVITVALNARQWVSGQVLQALATGALLQSSQQRAQAKQLLRHLLRAYLGDKPIKSRELFTANRNHKIG